MDQPCPVCLQPSCVHDAESVLLPCCGHFGHLPCILQCMRESSYTYRSCLFCQEIIDEDAMLVHLQKWVDLQKPWAQQIMGSLYVTGIKEEKGRLLLLASAKQNNPVAQACLGFHFYHKSSYLQAYNWYKRSAFDHEYHIALYNLAFLMEHGIGCEKNEQLAIGLYKRSAQQGNFLAERAADYLENEEPNGTDTSEESAEADLLIADGPQLCALQ
jgi:TPR repeat protein